MPKNISFICTPSPFFIAIFPRISALLILLINLAPPQQALVASNILPGSIFQSAMAASSSTAANSNNNYYCDVFINHRGTDVKKTFASHLYRRLLSSGLRIFLDQPELERGDYFPSQIESAIRSASVHIAIFSPGYAESSWCLNELVQMLESKATIIPVFHHVNPSELRWTRGKKRKYAEALEEPACGPQPHEQRRYAEALEKLEKKTTSDPQTHEERLRYNSTTMEKWRDALSRVADISGFELDECNGDEGKLVDNVVERVLKKVKKPALEVAKYPTGLDYKVRDFEYSVLLQQHFKPQILGIVGLGGVGKTTLAKEFYNRKKSEYQTSCFLFDVRSNSLTSLQTELLNSLSGLDNRVHSIDEGIGMIRKHLSSAKALVIIDDVDHVDQLDALLPHQTVLHLNSLVLITSRNNDVLTSKVEDTSIYKLTGLNTQHSEELFCSHAFHQPYPLSGFKSLVEKYLVTCNGLPLSLKVFGALLYGKDISYCEEQLESLQQILPTTEIHHRFRISYNSLSEHEKQIFLDIACFLRGENKDMAINIWEGSAWKGRLGFENLQNKSLVEVNSKDEIQMHDHLRDMGRDIAAEDSRILPRRLWRWTENTIDDLLPSAPDGQVIPVRGIRMDLSEYNGFDDKDALGGIGMKRLQLLDIEDFLLDRILPKVQSPNLIWLRWENCPHSYLPSSIPMKDLRVLHVTGNELETLWQDEQAPLQLRELEIHAPLCNIPKSIGKLKHLERFVIGHTSDGENINLQSLGDEFCNLQSLKALVLRDCFQMKSLPECFGNLTNLQLIDLHGCSELERLPDSFFRLINLQHLHLAGCSNLTMSAETLGNISRLEYISLQGCKRIEVLPLQVVHQRSLEQLYLKGTNLKELPSAIGELSDLEILEVESPSLDTLPPSLGDLRNLKVLSISDCKELKCLPASLGTLSQLTQLSVEGCPLLDTLPPSLGDLRNLKKLDIYYCQELKCLPASLGTLSELISLRVMGCPLLDMLPPSLGDLRNLTLLLICDCNELKCLPASLGFLSQLTQLRLYRCSLLDTLPPSLGDLRNLKELDITDCKELKCLPASLGLLSQLTSLMVRGCPLLDTLPPMLGDLWNLKKLNIINCMELKCLPASLGHLSQLTELTIKKCPLLDTLPPSLGDLRNLKVLSISDCKELKCLQASLGTLSQLNRLSVRGCPLLDTLPPSLGDLRNLKYLLISGFKEWKCLPAWLGTLSELTVTGCPLLDTLQPSLGDFRNLTVLYISYCNELKCLPASLGLLSELTSLTVEGCPLLDTLPPSLGDLRNLKKLVISNCKELKCLPASLGDLRNLKHLYIIDCKELKCLPASLGDLRNLKDLYIIDCQELKCLPASLGTLSELISLSVMRCPLLDMLPPTLGDLWNLKDLYISDCKELKCLPASLELLSQLKMRVVGCPLLGR